jgi:SAM-dependent methyltransferase
MVTPRSDDAHILSWKQEEAQPFAGWDFSYLEGRMFEEQPPWSYAIRAAQLMRHASAILDMGTGGGERLLALREHWPHKVTATEDYPPNIALARSRLEPLGVQVLPVPLSRDGPMPFGDGEFNLVTNRHSGLNCDEVARVLAPRGIFLTQQVHGLWAQDLLAVFDARPQWPDARPETYVPNLERAGLRIECSEEWRGQLTFTDVGAIVYYLRAVPWLVPGFSVDRHSEHLLGLQRRLETGETLAFRAWLYLIEAHKHV